MNNEIIRDILKDYDKKRLKSKSDLEYRKKELYEMVPELKEIDRKISLISIDISKCTFSRPDNYNEKISDLKEKLESLKSKRKNIYTKNSIPLNYLEPSYQCEICNDTGYLQNGDKCICFKQEIINQLYKRIINAKKNKIYRRKYRKITMQYFFNSYAICIISTSSFKVYI